MKKTIFATLALFSQLAMAKLVIIDVRTPEEYKSGHISEALNIDVTSSNFSNEISKLDKNDDFEVYCRSGKRSTMATQIMNQNGFKKVTNLGGFEDAKRKHDKK
jgi:phage shock protein E